MKAVVVEAAGQQPAYADFAEPVATAGEVTIAVAASALSPLARARASGAHYSSGSNYPFVAGVDGVGRLGDGRRVYFLLPRAPFGAMAERTVVADGQWTPVPDEVDDALAAAIANPGMSSWAALTHRADLRAGETVLVNGATGVAGRLAVAIARHLGAARIIATGRSRTAPDELGADQFVPLDENGDGQAEAFESVFSDRVDVVLDYLWGPSARTILLAAAKAAPAGAPLCFVQIGSVSAGEIALPAEVLRSSSIQLLGSGLGSVSVEGLMASISGVLAAVVPANLRVGYNLTPLSQFAEAWNSRGGRSVVTT